MAQYIPDPHHYVPFGKKSRVPYQFCINCGFIYMKNELSEWTARQGCNYREHPSYKSKLGLTSPFKE